MTADAVSRALVCVADDDTAGARRHLEGSTSRLAGALRRGLDDIATADGVYVDPTAFTRFIDSEPNVMLYDDVHTALRTWLRAAEDGVRGVVDIGCGDGRVTEAVLPPGVERIELVEPSAALLDEARRRLESGTTATTPSGIETAPTGIETWPMGVGEWLDAAGSMRRDVGWSSFALHNLPPDERLVALSGIAATVGRFAVVEFDVPEASSVEEWAQYCADRYVQGAQQHDDPLVLSGFLVPVLLGQFAPGATRHTFEQPLRSWEAEFRAAGFTDTALTMVHDDFWWAPAGIVSGVGLGPAGRSTSSHASR